MPQMSPMWWVSLLLANLLLLQVMVTMNFFSSSPTPKKTPTSNKTGSKWKFSY